MEEKKDTPFGIYLRQKMKQSGMSIRKLSLESGLGPSTISRIMTGNQKPLPDHLDKIAPVLKLTVLELWQAAGYIRDEQPVKEQGNQLKTCYLHLNTTNEGGLQSGLDFASFKLPLIEGLDPMSIIAELSKYRVYAQTTEGQEIILQNFSKKLDQIKGVGPFINKLQAMYNLYLDEGTDPEIKYIIGSVLLYFILPTDIIPDYLFPIGYLDDAMATELVWTQIHDLLAK